LSASTHWEFTTGSFKESIRTAAWADGGVNDICPVGFSVPTKEELKKDTVANQHQHQYQQEWM
jgi:hypothetical protein